MNPKMTTNYYKVLEIISDNQIQIGKTLYCPLGQGEIAEILSCNRMTVNGALKWLKEEGYIENESKKRYFLTAKGTDTVNKAKDIQ